MKRAQVLMIGLDGFELEIANRLLAQGKLPALKRLKASGATVLLEHGPAKRTGLGWEHISTGRSPDDYQRWSAIDFDPHTYNVAQFPTRSPPFLDGLNVSAVVFDPPYFDLVKAQNASGLVNWGAHDPGVAPTSRPRALASEIEDRFGAYPAADWIYGLTWPSVDRTEAMGAAMVAAVEKRSSIAQWLLGERFPDWELGMVVLCEYHSVIEAMWHGVDPDHPLHDQPSADGARRSIEGVYEAGDRMLGALANRFPEAKLVVFGVHGMGPNNSDVPSMLLLPELLYRDHFGTRLFKEPQWAVTPRGIPVLDPGSGWEADISSGFPPDDRLATRLQRKFASAARRLGVRSHSESVDWMPAARYRRFWPEMPAFALPSYYDGQIRLNLAGRERDGTVQLMDYDRVCDRLENLLRECTDPITGRGVVEEFVRPRRKNQLELAPSEADILILWAGTPLGFSHPRLGKIGPAPFRRTGGHTGPSGVAFFSDSSGLAGVSKASSFDVVPTVVSMLGLEPVRGLSGRSMASEPICRRASVGSEQGV